MTWIKAYDEEGTFHLLNAANIGFLRSDGGVVVAWVDGSEFIIHDPEAETLVELNKLATALNLADQI